MNKLEVKLDSVVSEAKVDIALPTFVQTQGLTEKDAMVFIGECADGKRKIAKAVRNKYETITNEESGITEYSTFEEMSAKIADIPITVPMGSAMEQNGGVLPFYDVYNEALKAWDTFGGRGYKGCCAFELDKWSYDDDHKVTLSGASAYYTSDKGELITTDTEYQFKDIDQPNTNRFVVYFFDIKEGDKYQVPKSLPATSCLGLWCIKGTPLMNFNSDFTTLNSINVYDGYLDVKNTNDFKLNSISLNQKLSLPHIKSISGGTYIISGNGNLRELFLPNLTTISGGTYIFQNNSSVRSLFLPNLTTISGGNSIFSNNSLLKEITLPNLTTIMSSDIFSSNTNLREIILPNLTTISSNRSIFVSNTNLKVVSMPKVTKISYNLFSSAVNLTEFDIRGLQEYTSTASSLFAHVTLNEVNLPNMYKCLATCSSSTTFIKIIHLGNGMRDGVVGDIRIVYSGTTTYLTTLTVAKGFKAKLNLTGCNGLSREVLVDIINNLADLTDTEYADKLTLTLGSTLYDRITADDRLIATNKKWQVVK